MHENIESGSNFEINPAIKLPDPIIRQYKCSFQSNGEHL